MSLAFRNHEVFYLVQPGDTLSGIAHKMGRNLASVIDLNPHLTDPDLIRPNDIVVLGMASGAAAPSLDDLQEMQSVLRSASTDTLQLGRKAFDILNYLSHLKDGTDFINSVGEQTSSFIHAAQPYTVAFRHDEMWSVSTVYREIYEARRDGIALLQSYQLSLTRHPVLILSVSANGFYPYAEQLKRLLRLADKLKLGKTLAIVDYGIEGAKVAVVAVEQGGHAAAKQALQGGSKIAGGALGLAAGKQVCAITIGLGPWGIAGCAVALGIGIWGGQAGGEWLGGTVGEYLPSHL